MVLFHLSRRSGVSPFAHAVRSGGVEVAMRRQHELETDEERDLRLEKEAQTKRENVAADDAAIDRMIKRNIEQYGA
jgi:hypothetical protein